MRNHACRKPKIFKKTTLAAGCLLVSAGLMGAAPGLKAEALKANVEISGNTFNLMTDASYKSASLRISGPNGYSVDRFIPLGQAISVDLMFEAGLQESDYLEDVTSHAKAGDILPDGTYQFEVLLFGDSKGAMRHTGSFVVSNGIASLQSGAAEQDRMAAQNTASTKATNTGGNHFSGDVTIAGDLCVGSGECPDGYIPGKELEVTNISEVLVRFEDTGAATATWDIGLDGDPAQGFKIKDVDAGTAPFRVLPGTTTDSVVVDSSAIGVNTSTPAEELHIATATPEIRLEDTNDGSFFNLDNVSGMFFIEGSGAETRRFAIDGSNGNIGMGTISPSSSLHVSRTDGSTNLLVQEASGTIATRALFTLENNGPMRFQMNNSGGNPTLDWAFSTGTSGFSISHVGTAAEALIRNNGDLEIRGTLMQNSSVASKDQITEIDGNVILDKIDTLQVAEWSYKSDSRQRHIGPMAEDFYATFGLGRDDKHISPTDMAGVALAAAKALKAENEVLRETVEDLKNRLDALEAAQ